MSQSKKIAKNAAIVSVATLASRILGFLRDLIVAFALGAGLYADAFFVAFRIPNLMRRLFGEGSLTMAFVPVYSLTSEEQGMEAAHEMARSALAWLVAVLGLITALVMFLAGPLTTVIAPGFTDNPELFHTTVTLVRICFPYTIFICAVALCMGILNSEDHFLAPALAPCVLNVCLIASALLGHFAGMNVALAMSFGVLAGGVGQWLLQQPFLRRKGISWKGKWSWKNPAVIKMGKLMLPTVFGAAVYQVNILLSTLLASFLPIGSISYLYYADRLVQFPLGVFGIAISTAALPSLSRLAAKNRMDEFHQALSTSMNLSMFISLPAAAGLMGLSLPIIHVLFGHGRFTDQAVSATAQALVAYGAGLPFIALARPLVSAFYSLQDTKTPVKIAVVCVLVNIGLGAVLMQSMAHVGLALAVSASGVVNVVLLLIAFYNKTGIIPFELKPVVIFLALSIAVGIGSFATAHNIWLGLGLLPVWAVGYFLACLGLKNREARMFLEIVASRTGRKKSV